MKEKLLKIINTYGVDNQLRQFHDEYFELIEAITTHELKDTVQYEIPLTEIIGTKEHITEKIAYLMLVLEQFKLYYDISSEDITKLFWQKVDKELESIENEQR